MKGVRVCDYFYWLRSAASSLYVPTHIKDSSKWQRHTMALAPSGKRDKRKWNMFKTFYEQTNLGNLYRFNRTNNYNNNNNQISDFRFYLFFFSIVRCCLHIFALSFFFFHIGRRFFKWTIVRRWIFFFYSSFQRFRMTIVQLVFSMWMTVVEQSKIDIDERERYNRKWWLKMSE